MLISQHENPRLKLDISGEIVFRSALFSRKILEKNYFLKIGLSRDSFLRNCENILIAPFVDNHALTCWVAKRLIDKLQKSLWGWKDCKTDVRHCSKTFIYLSIYPVVGEMEPLSRYTTEWVTRIWTQVMISKTPLLIPHIPHSVPHSE